MNKRIERVASYIDENDLIADIGCDQALLSEVLAKRGIYSLASDIRENIILNAKKRIDDLDLSKFVKFVVSDGVQNIDDNIDTLSICGMGTYTILDIISKAKKQYKKIITISNNNHEILRKNMLDLGYKIKCEDIIYEKNKYYNLIIFVPGKCEYTEEETLFGYNHINKEILNKKLKLDLIKYKNIYSKSNNKELLRKINIIEKMLMNH